MSLILSCEHASNYVPKRFQAAFASRTAQRTLVTHYGVDLGAAALARLLRQGTGAPLFLGRWTRLLIDLNRSAHHPRLLSTWSRTLGARDLLALRAEHARHWNSVFTAVRDAQSPVVHLAVHSFVPELAGQRRPYDVGLLYDPARARERRLVDRLRDTLRQEGLSVRRNAPYRGVSDGLPTALRGLHAERRYAGIELEINQTLLVRRPDRRVVRGLLSALGPK